MAKPRDPENYITRLGGSGYAVIWKNELHSRHSKYKGAAIALWRLKKIQEETGAEPVPSSRLDRLVYGDLVDKLTFDGVPRPPRPLSGLTCPDCGANLRLKEGKFGLFYGCEQYNKTLCRGSVSADSKGIPLGVPVNAKTRRARYVIRAVYSWLAASKRTYTPVNRLQEMDLGACQAHLAQLCEDHPEIILVIEDLPDHIHRTRLERLLSDEDPLDKMLGPIGVEALG